jgi:hypothetical protein
VLGESISVINWCQTLPCLHFFYHDLRPLEDKYSYAIETTAFETHADLIAEVRRNQENRVSAEFTFGD